jgi:hypothetical protein
VVRLYADDDARVEGFGSVKEGGLRFTVRF